VIAERTITPEECTTLVVAAWEKASVTPVFYFPNERRRDEDNAIASLKAAYDGIVDAGLLPDDDHKHMQRERPEFKIDKRHPRVELTIERLT
jgi:crossover junction endodeoxyribonuclease RusA